MRRKLLTLFLFLFLINFVIALPTCSDTNEIDISGVPCNALTVPIDCSGNITIFNSTNVLINTSVETSVFTDDIYNFTVNLTRGGYEFVDCANNTATVLVGLFEQGYGINLFGVIFPTTLLTIISLFVSGRLFKRFGEEDEEEEEHKIRENDEESFVPKSRLMPIVIMLFSFIPMIFMIGFVNNYLEEYLSTANITTFYGTFYILFSTVFYFVFLISFLVWLSSFIKLRRVMRGLDEID